MELRINISHEIEIEIHRKIALKISKALEAAIAVEKDLHIALEKALDEGIVKRQADSVNCPNCGAVFFRDHCPHCQQGRDDSELLDHDPEEEDRQGEDLSDSEDADEPLDARDEEDEKLPPLEKRVTFVDCLKGYLRDVGVQEDQIPLFLFLIKEMLASDKGPADKINNVILTKAAMGFGKTEQEVCEIWSQRPFEDEELIEVLEECFVESREFDEELERPPLLLEIRKVGNDYVPLVSDPYEDLVINSAKRRKWIPVGRSGHKFSAGLVLKKKEEQKAILYKILETIVALRRDFLDAKNRKEALCILEERPFEQKDVVDRHGLDKGTVSRHFSDKSIKTPHGFFMLSDLARTKSLEQEDMTVKVLQDTVKLIIEEGDKNGQFYSDQKIADMITKEGIKISREYVTKIRKELNIRNSRRRKKCSGE